MPLDPVLYFGAFRIPVYSLLLIAALVATAWLGVLRTSERRTAWLDAALAALLISVIGARIEYVLLSWDHFAAHTDEILRFELGGLGWHGAVIGTYVGAALMARLRGLNAGEALRRFAWAFPLIALGAWIGCGAAGCAYGREVDTLANYPAWLVWEARDVYGILAPRWNTPLFGALLALIVALVGVFVPSHRRFPVMLAFLSLGMFLIGFLRADASPLIVGFRADQLLDLAFFLLGIQGSLAAKSIDTAQSHEDAKGAK